MQGGKVGRSILRLAEKIQPPPSRRGRTLRLTRMVDLTLEDSSPLLSDNRRIDSSTSPTPAFE